MVGCSTRWRRPRSPLHSTVRGCSLREVLTQEPVGVLVGSALPRTSWISKVDGDAGLDSEGGVLGQFLATVPRQRSAELLGQCGDRRCERVLHGHGAVTAEGGPFFLGGMTPYPSSRGRWSSMVKRVVRSTSVPIADRSSPMTRSPSQCPGTAGRRLPPGVRRSSPRA